MASSSSSHLDVNEHHEEILREYLRYSREQKSLSLRSIRSLAENFKTRRLADESMMTIKEIEDLLEEFLELIEKEFEQEFTHQSRVNTLLIKQFFQQAELWFLKLNPNFDQLENRRLIDLIHDYEQNQLSKKKKTDLLDPINDTKSTILLKTEIQKLQQLNQQLKTRLQRYETDDDRVEELTRVHSNKEASFQETLSSNEKRLKDIQHALTLAENELEKKFNQTQTYLNMKKILEQKNQQIRELRQQLAGKSAAIDED